MCHRLLRIIVKGRRRRIATTCAMFLRGRRTAFFFFRDIVCQAGNIDLLSPFSRRIFVNRRILVDKINYYQNRKILSILWLILFNLYIYIYISSIQIFLHFRYFITQFSLFPFKNVKNGSMGKSRSIPLYLWQPKNISRVHVVATLNLSFSFFFLFYLEKKNRER